MEKVRPWCGQSSDWGRTWLTKSSTRRGQHTFPSEYYEDWRTCFIFKKWMENVSTFPSAVETYG